MYIFKKTSFYLFLIFSIVAAVCAYFNLKESKAPQTNISEHILANVSCVIETNSLHDLISKLTRQNLIWNSLLTQEIISNTQNGIHYLDSLTKSNQDVYAMLEDNNVFWSFIKQNERTENLIQFKLKEQKDDGKLDLFFNTVFKKNSTVSSFKAYDFLIGQKQWLACCVNGIVYFCSDLTLLQKCIELKKNESIAGNKNYEKLLRLNGKQKTQIYVNHSICHLFNSSIFKNYSVFSLEVSLNEISCNGYTDTDSVSLVNLLVGQNERAMKEFNKLPDHVASFSAFAVSNANLFYEKSLKFLSEHLQEKNQQSWKNINDSALYDMQLECYENLDGEIVIANYWLENSPSQLLLLKVNDESKALQLLKLMSDSVKTVNDYKVYKLLNKHQQLFSINDQIKDMRYACVVSGNIIFMSDYQLLLYYLESIKNSMILGKNVEFLAYANENLSQSSNYINYENNDQMKLGSFSRLINSLHLNLGDDVISDVSLSIKSYKQTMQVRLHAAHKQEHQASEVNQNVLWSFLADSLILGKAHIFKNHLTQENELCFQDENNTLYLLNSKGSALWKKNITEIIRSDIYTVDVFKNGKFQLLFNTDNYLHLIDRNGAYVQGYPVKLPQRVTSSITLMDYDNSKDYRIFLACADKKIYNFSLYGLKTEGFVPVKTNTEVILPIYYAKVGASDYLITADVEGKIYAFSRRGEGRIDFKNKVTTHLERLYVEMGNNLDNAKLIYVDDKNNLLNKISLSDKKEGIKLGDELNGFDFSFDLLNDDKQTDVILFGDGAIYAYDLFSEKLLDSFNSQAVYRDAVLVYSESSQCMIGFDDAGKKLDFIDLNGKLMYSVKGVTNKPLVADLYKDGKKYLIVTQRNRINCMLLN